MSLFRAAIDGLVPYEPGKPEEEVQRELGLARVVKLASNEGPWGPFPAALEALERSAGSLNRYPDGGAFHLRNAIAARHDVEPANVITGAGADAIIGHLSRRSARSRRRGRHGLALVHQLRARRTEGRRRAAEGAARRRPLRPGRAARRDRAEDEAGLHRDAEQPHGHDDDARRARLLLRTRPRARPHRSRPGLLRVHRPARLSRRRRGVPRPRPPRARAADVLEDLRARRPTRRLRRRPAGRDPGDRQDPARIRRRHAGTGRRARQHRRCRRARRAAPADRGRARPRSSERCASTGSSRPGLRSGTSSSSRSARTRPRSSTRCSARARSSARWARSALRARCGSRSGRRTRTHSSPRRSPPSGRRRPKPRLSWGPSRALRARFPYADHPKERNRPRSGRQRQRPGRSAARRALADHDLPPAGAAAALALGVRPHGTRVGRRRSPRPDRLRSRRRVSLVPPDRRGRSGIDSRSQGRGEAARRRAAARPAHHGARDRLRQARRRGQGDAVALRHDHARTRRSGDEVDLDDVVSARPLRRDPLPGQAGASAHGSTTPTRPAARRGPSRPSAS